MGIPQTGLKQRLYRRLHSDLVRYHCLRPAHHSIVSSPQSQCLTVLVHLLFNVSASVVFMTCSMVSCIVTFCLLFLMINSSVEVDFCIWNRLQRFKVMKLSFSLAKPQLVQC